MNIVVLMKQVPDTAQLSASMNGLLLVETGFIFGVNISPLAHKGKTQKLLLNASLLTPHC